MITVIGGTGRLGSIVTAELVRQGHDVRVVARHRPAVLDGVEFIAADVRDPTTIAAAVEGSSVVVSAINGLDPAAGQSPADVDRDGNLRLIAAARDAGARLVLMSIIGAREDSPIEIARMKAAAEHAARETDGLEWTIIRAAAFAELWRDVLRQTAGRSGRPTVFGRGENPINVVSVEDVAVAVAHAALDPTLVGAIIDVGGPRNVTMNELATWATGSKAPRHIPRGMLRVGAAVSAPVRPAIARLMRQALAMDTTDLTFDPTGTCAQYPWLPCSDVVGQAALSV
jgi:NADH dehydrogenase